MPYKHYVSDYRNQVHQLLVTLSRNYYVTKEGNLKHQKKALPHTLKTVSKAKKTRVIHFILRDHFSGVFYAEMYRHTGLPNIGRFLYRAWSEKSDYEFCGIPEALMVPEIVSTKWPGINNLLSAYRVGNIKPTSGFAAGAIGAKNWQRAITDYVLIEAAKKSKNPYRMEYNFNFDRLQERNTDICKFAVGVDRFRSDPGMIATWRQSDTELFVPTEEEDFARYFEV